MSTTVHVANISHETSEQEVQEFFSFCGKISSLSVTPASGEPNAPKSATVIFEKEAAAKTALLLDNTQLGPNSVQVTAAASIDEIAGGKAAAASEAKDEQNQDIEQEDKPRSRIVAEYLAQGYTISDNAIQQAIALDKKHGISQRFTAALQSFEQKLHAKDKAKELDQNLKLTDKATTGWRGLSSYFEKALDTPTGRKVRDFYMQSDKQVRDIHSEARRLADLKSGKAQPITPPEGGEAAPTVAPSGAPTESAPPKA